MKKWLAENTWALKVVGKMILPLADIYVKSTKTQLDDTAVAALKIAINEINKR